MPHAQLIGLGTAAPVRRLAQADVARFVAERCCRSDRDAQVIATLFRRAGVDSRGIALLDDDPGADGMGRFYPAAVDPRSASPGTAARMRAFRRLAPPLATRASRTALDDAALDPGAITDLVTVTCTGFAAPGLEVALVRELGLPPTVRRTQVGFMGCHAAINGLRVAGMTARSEPDARILVCAVELGSLHFRYGRRSDELVSNALFADGAAAAVIAATRAESSEDDVTWRLAATGSMLIDGTDDQMSWHIEDDGFVMTLSPRVPATIAENVRPWLDGWLAEHGTTVADVASWAIHAGGPRIVTAVADRLGLDETSLAASRAVLAENGNMSSATILFILDRLRAAESPRPCVLLSFGPGLAAEAALLG